MSVIDVHTHYIPSSFLDSVSLGAFEGVSIESREGKSVSLIFKNGMKHPLNSNFTSIEARLDVMKSRNVTKHVMCISPRLFFYDLDAELGLEYSKQWNDEIFSAYQRYPEKITPMGTLPMQDIDAAIYELRRISALGFRSIQIGTTVNGINLSDLCFEPFFKETASLGILVMLHPLIIPGDALSNKFELSNLIGNAYQTTSAASHLLLSGIFDKIPELKVLLVHGGGYLPWQIGRIEHGTRVKQSLKDTRKPLSDAFGRNLLFDDVTHSAESLNLLINVVGEDNVLHGSDFPYDMEEYSQSDFLAQSGYGEGTMKKIMTTNAERYGL